MTIPGPPPDSRDSLGDRMKRYERAHDLRLPGRLPVIVRVDGRAFHTWTRPYKRPFDETLMGLMNRVALALCREISGAQVAYLQSDEVSVLVHSYKRHETQAWVDNRLQKVASLAGSIASSEMTYLAERRAQFDARAFVLPEADVTNYFLWRQQDATRNSLQMLARSLYSHRELERANTEALQEMCWQKGRNWNDLPTAQKRGRCTLYGGDLGWVVDNEIPIFKAEGRDYIERFLAVESEETA